MWRCKACACNMPSNSGDCAGSTGSKLCGAALLNRKPGIECIHRITVSIALYLLNLGLYLPACLEELVLMDSWRSGRPSCTGLSAT